MSSIGIDIGTTTISAVRLSETDAVESVITLSNDSSIPTVNKFDLQDPERVLDICMRIMDELWDDRISSVGVTGQMHGMLYVDGNGNACSSLATWQDKRGDIYCGGTGTYCDEMNKLTGYGFSTGFGLATLFYDAKKGLIPNEAVSICTIPDFIAMRLAGRNTPALHVSMAQSMGGFDIKAGRFDIRALNKLELPVGLLPAIHDETVSIGTFRGSDVFPAIGDNQASVYGTCRDESHLLLNIGTGSQISMIVDSPEPVKGLELRPYIFGKYILSGSSLCGGSAYDVLVDLVYDVLGSFDAEKPDRVTVIRKLDSLALDSSSHDLSVNTRFLGTREDPAVTGSITGITPEDLTIGNLADGFIRGVCRELADFHALMPHSSENTLCLSGNAVRNSAVYRDRIAEFFPGYRQIIRSYREEAAFGAAMFASAVKTGRV